MKRYHIIFSITILLFLGSLVTTLAAIQERDFQLRGYIDASLDPELPFRVPRLGVNAQLYQYNPTQLAQNLALMETAHVTWVRQFVRWASIETEQNKYDWQATDRLFDALKLHPNLKPIVVLVSTPTWARPDNDDPNAPPADNDDFARFAEAFASRYGHWVDY